MVCYFLSSGNDSYAVLFDLYWFLGCLYENMHSDSVELRLCR